jgi:hypothetical protein
MMRLVAHSSTDPPRIVTLWERYLALRAEIEELNRATQRARCPQGVRIAIEVEKLEPRLLELDDIAEAIADLPAKSRSALEVKARVLLDYLDDSDLDASQRLARSLCNSILSPRG